MYYKVFVISIKHIFYNIYPGLFMLFHSLNARYNIITPISINIEARITIIISLNNRISKPISIKIIPILKI